MHSKVFGLSGSSFIIHRRIAMPYSICYVKSFSLCTCVASFSMLLEPFVVFSIGFSCCEFAVCVLVLVSMYIYQIWGVGEMVNWIYPSGDRVVWVNVCFFICSGFHFLRCSPSPLLSCPSTSSLTIFVSSWGGTF